MIDTFRDIQIQMDSIAKDLTRKYSREEVGEEGDGLYEREVMDDLNVIESIEMNFITLPMDSEPKPNIEKMRFILGEERADDKSGIYCSIPVVIMSTISDCMGEDGTLPLPSNTKYRKDRLYIDGENVGSMTSVEHTGTDTAQIGIWDDFYGLDDAKFIADEMFYAIDAHTHSPHPGLTEVSIETVSKKWGNNGKLEKLGDNSALCYWNTIGIEEEHRNKGYARILMRNALARHYHVGAVVFVTASYRGAIYDEQGERFEGRRLHGEDKEATAEYQKKWDDKQKKLLKFYQKFFKDVGGERLMLDKDRSLVGIFPGR